MTDESIDARVASARSSLESTLDQLDDKLNLPKQGKKLAENAKNAYSQNPVPWIIGGAAAAVAIVGTIAWAILSDD